MLVTLLLVGCGAAPVATTSDPPKEARNEVIVLGMIHGEHRDHPTYDTEVIKAIVRAVRPRYALVEIPPDRLATALAEFRATGEVTEPRVKRFPEYVDALFPIADALGVEIVPCAGWTQTMADERKEKLARWKTERKTDHEQVERAQQEAEQLQASEGLDRDPWGIDSERYDAIVERGMEPYNRLFNADLGDGGWDNINAAHFALISKALDTHKNEGARFLVMFGAWHKYWFKKKLRDRHDVALRSMSDFYPRP